MIQFRLHPYSRAGLFLNPLIICLVPFILAGCLGYPESITPVTGFIPDRYFGRWYEIARLDHSFERGLENVTAEYARRKDGGIEVKNRGFWVEKREWKEAVGKAYFVRGPEEGYLKVSFFGPFYGAYVIFDLDTRDYQYAFVTSSNKNYLWLLSRTPVVRDDLKAEFERKATVSGFNLQELIWVNQDLYKRRTR